MKQLFLLTLIAALFVSCANQNNVNGEAAKETEKSAVVYTVDELYANASELAGKEVMVKGTVMHVCKQGGGRCFLMGSNEDVTIRVEAGEEIGAFSQEQMGSDLTIFGIFKEIKSEADAHNPAAEHEPGNNEEDTETEEAHRIIAQAEEQSETVYFMDGIRIVKEEI